MSSTILSRVPVGRGRLAQASRMLKEIRDESRRTAESVINEIRATFPNAGFHRRKSVFGVRGGGVFVHQLRRAGGD